MITIRRNDIQEFVLLLRERGIQVGISEHLDAQICFSSFSQEGGHENQLFLALRSALVKKKENYDIFAKAYEDFFCLGAQMGRGPDLVPRFACKSKAGRSEAIGSGVQREEEGQTGDKTAILALYSDNRSQIPPIDIESVKPFNPEDVRSIARKLREVSRLNPILPGRRKSPSSNYSIGSYVDWRRIAKLISSNPNTIPEIRFRKRKRTRSKLVLMADVSGSMLKDAELVINSLFTASRRFHGTETFVFSTGLSKFTSFFSGASASRETIQQFYLKQTQIELGSGTRIGENLARMLSDYSTIISEETTLIIISDGWDLGDSDLLDACLREVKSRRAKVVWFHPHYGFPGFSPETVAMKTAMPYIDLMIGPSGHASRQPNE
ncbi:MAG: VWA domain-containing protein [Nitrososphaerota archaeon]|nr:VWA domain-containing protein [Nitrososphaerota archaeon]